MSNPHVDEIITSLADILIDGEYIDELNDGASLKGSSNQTVNFITDRYKQYRDLYSGKKRDVQIMIEGEKALLVGVPDCRTLTVWKRTSDELRGK